MNKLKNNVKLWKKLTIIFSSVFALLLAANIVGSVFATTINWFFNSSSETTSITGTGDIYYKSEFTKKDSDGNTILTEKGKETYDDDSLSAAGDEQCQSVCEEGFVLLSNNGALPLDKSSKISLFGQSCDNPVISGTGSGQTDGGSSTYLSGLKNGGFNVNESSYNFYSSGEGKNYSLSVPGMHDSNPFKINECPWDKITSSSDYNEIIDCDTAIVVFSRNGGEGFDLSNGVSDIGYDFGEIIVADGRTTEEGSLTGNNYLELNGDERGLLSGLKKLKEDGEINNIIVVLNSANAMQLDFLNKDICGVDYKIDACIWIGAMGQSGIDVLGPILSGDVNPSGHLSDTYCYDNLREPSVYNFGHNEYTNFQSDYRSKADQEDKYAWMGERYYNVYRENIYVGYRYYETRYEDFVLGNTQNYDYSSIVAYSFGHGLSYSEFAYSGFNVSDKGDSFEVEVTVKNVSEKAGKEVVQLYAQTPYTEYDKNNGIEKASVELVGFEKTGLLKNGESEKVKISFSKELLTAYDAYNSKTYIMEAGDYYFSLGNGAHDALNNILKMKGITEDIIPAAAPINFSSGDYAYKWSVNETDKTTYSVSSSTGEKIENQFDNADLNLFENGEQGITYVSRKNWKGTFDDSSVENMKNIQVNLRMTDMMYDDIKAEQYNEPDEAKDAVMPEQGVKNGLKLIMFRGVPYDGSIEYNGKTYTWNDLIDQMSIKDMRELIAQGQHTTRVIASVSKPSTSDQNGPSGFSSKFVGGGSGTSYPVPCLRSATWNKTLLKRTGELIGEDGLHSGCNGLYGPAANIHRNSFCGRNFEYYSEDPVLSGLVSENEVKGIQSKGIVVYMKHFVLNDSETHREGISTWINEQSFREIYLEAFRFACSKDGGNSHAVMSGFNRIGTTWCGDSSALMNGVLRGEWGFDGFVITDADACDTTTHCTLYMYAPRAITTGTDLYDGVNNHSRTDQLTAYSKDAYVVNAMRTASMRILYTVSNSAAMNGLSVKTEVKSAVPVWQIILIVLVSLAGILAIASALMFVLNKINKIKFPYKEEN